MTTYSYNIDDAEIERLQTLLSYNILDTPQEDEFDNLVKLISLICNTPIALISMLDDRRQWNKAKIGIEPDEVPQKDVIPFSPLLHMSNDLDGTPVNDR